MIPGVGAAVVNRALTPRSVVVVGASDQPGKLGTNLVKNLESYPGDVYYVNPRRREINGSPVYSSVEAIEAELDLALILIPVEQVSSAVEQCARAGVAVSIILSAGFHELGEAGTELKRDILATAAQSGMRLMGPNCTGAINTAVPLRACMVAMPDVRPGRLGLFGQSGALLGGLLWDYCELDGLGLGCVVTLGDKIDVGEMDVLEYLLSSDDIAVAAGYIESLDDPREWLTLCARFTKSKPLILLHGGQTRIGMQASWSHTGRLVRPSRVLNDALARSGVTEVDDFPTLLGYAAGFDYLSQFPGAKRRVAVATTSGAIGVVLADHIARAGLEIALLGDGTIESIVTAGLAGSGFSASEQIDLELPGEQLGLTRAVCECIEILSRDADVDVIFLALAALGHFADLDPLAVAQACRGSAKPVFVWPYGRNDLKKEWREGFGEALRVSANPKIMAACLGAFERWRCHHVESSSVENDEPESIPSPLGNLLDETDLRERLKQWSLPFVEARIVERKSELASAAADLRYPVVLKHLLEGQSHKTEHDAVALNVIDESELLAQSTRMDRGGKWLLQSMVDGAIEAFIGVSRDPQLGPVISVGMGGVLVELIADVTSGPAPLDADAARNLIASTRLGSLIAGYRGARPGDFESLVGLVVRVSQIATEWTELVELDLNPVMVLEVGEGVVIVDARARAL